MIQIQAWKVDYHLGKLDPSLLVHMDKLKLSTVSRPDVIWFDR